MRTVHVVLCFAAASLAACPKDADTETETETDTEDTDTDTDTEDTDTEPTCSGVDLCARTRGECAVDITEDACLAFYDPETTTCGDIEGYTLCNCSCVTEDTCELYFECGTTCFEDWC